ncbi:MAG: AIR synthase family protein [Christensenellaceae bacterium]|jgi:hydrogenase maturation factor|nr:AIR synthase family protein [Christensenellaceae bacterium]
MRLGKLSNDQLNTLVLSKFKHIRPEVICSPQVGVDCAAVQLGGRLAVLSTDPITSAGQNLGWLTVHVSCNDAAAAGAEPIGLLVTLLAPPTASEADIGRVADELSEAARQANIDIIGGHTEVTDSVTRMVTCATVIARAGERGVITPDGMREGDDVVMTKYAGLEGTAVIAADFAHRLTALSANELEQARGFLQYVSVVKEGLFAAEHGATALHDITEGGVYGAAWEMASASGCGIRLFEESIPLHPLTQKICALLAIDPYRLLSSGSMLIACANGQGLVSGLGALGIGAAVIGKAGGQGVRLTSGELLLPPEADALYGLFADVETKS